MKNHIFLPLMLSKFLVQTLQCKKNAQENMKKLPSKVAYSLPQKHMLAFSDWSYMKGTFDVYLL